MCLGFPVNGTQPPPPGTTLQIGACAASNASAAEGQLFVLQYLAGGTLVSVQDVWGGCWTVNGTGSGAPWLSMPCLGKANQAFLLQSAYLGTAPW